SSGKLNDAINSKADQIAIGYVYNLSKRTALYATYSHINNKNGALATFSGGNGSSSGLAAATGTGNGYDLGLKTSF
ncbi:MAG: porin, partial [Rhodoferax sp.]